MQNCVFNQGLNKQKNRLVSLVSNVVSNFDTIHSAGVTNSVHSHLKRVTLLTPLQCRANDLMKKNLMVSKA